MFVKGFRYLLFSLFLAFGTFNPSITHCYARSHQEWVQIMQQVVGVSADSAAGADKSQGEKSSNPANLYGTSFFSFNPKVATPESYLGYEIGSNHVRHQDIVGYSEALCKGSQRLHQIQYGKTHEGRKLFVIVASKNPKALDGESLFNDAVDRRKSWLTGESSTQPLSNDIPTVIQLAYSVHGNEAAPANAAMLVLYFLAAAEGDWIEQFLEQSIVIVDPCLNPDGFDRFSGWVRSNRGRFPSKNPADLEHNEPFPTSRTNHYGFDLNRDWLPATQLESQGRLELYYKWLPNLFMDFHEMSASQSLFFQPGIEGRDHPATPPFVRDTTERFAQHFSKVLDHAGERYFTNQRFDDYFPGKGSTFPDLQGGVGVLVEQGTTSGLVLEEGETTRTFSDTIANPLRLSIASLFAIQREHRTLLEYQREFFGQSRRGEVYVDKKLAPTNYLVKIPPDSRIASEWLSTLERHHIKIFESKESHRLDEVAWPAESTWVIPSAQHQSRYLQTIMERRRDFAFSKFYDVSAWNLADAFGLQWTTTDQHIPVGKAVTPLSYRSALKGNILRDLSGHEIRDYRFPAIGVNCGQAINSTILANSLGEAKLTLRITAEPMVVIDQKGTEQAFSAGSFFLLKSDAPQNWEQNAKVFVNKCIENNFKPIPLPTGLSRSGIDLGSSDVRRFKIPRVGIVLDSQSQTSSAGSLWYTFDHVFQWPISRIHRDQLDADSLRTLDVIILPEVYKPSTLDIVEPFLERWLLEGGHIIAVGNAISEVEILAKKTISNALKIDDLGVKEVASRRLFPTIISDFENIPGTQLQGKIQQKSSVADLVFSEKFNFVQNGNLIAIDLEGIDRELWKPVAQLDKSSWLSGFLSKHDHERLDGKVIMAEARIGQGKMTLLTFDPTFRGHNWDSMNLLRALIVAE